MNSTNTLNEILNITPFPLVSWYGSAIRPIEQLRLLFKACNVTIRTVASYASQDVNAYVYPNHVNALNSFLMPALFRMGFNPNRFIHDIIFINYLKKVFLLNRNINKLYIHLTFTERYVEIIKKIFNFRNMSNIIDVHGISTYSIENSLLSKLFSNIVESVAYKNSVIVVSNASIKEYLKRSFGLNDSFIIPDVIDVSHIEEIMKKSANSIEKIKVYLNITPRDFIIGYAGSINFIQGSDILIKTMKLLLKHYTNIKFLIVGSSFSKLQRLTKTLNISFLPSEKKRIMLLSNIPYFILPKYLSIANILITPKRYNFESNQKLLLYAAIGKPIICFNTYANRFLSREFNLTGVFLAKELSTEAFIAEIMNLIDKIYDTQSDEYNYGALNRNSIKLTSIKIIENLKNLLINSPLDK